MTDFKFNAFMTLGMTALCATTWVTMAYNQPDNRLLNFSELPAVATVLAKYEEPKTPINFIGLLKKEENNYKLVISFAAWTGKINVDKKLYDKTEAGDKYIVHYRYPFNTHITSIVPTDVEPKLTKEQINARIFEEFNEEEGIKIRPELKNYYESLNFAKEKIKTLVEKQEDRNWFNNSYKIAVLKNIYNPNNNLPNLEDLVKEIPQSKLERNLKVSLVSITGALLEPGHIVKSKSTYYVPDKYSIFINGSSINTQVEVDKKTYEAFNSGDKLIVSQYRGTVKYLEATNLEPKLTQGQINTKLFENYDIYSNVNGKLKEVHYALNQTNLFINTIVPNEEDKVKYRYAYQVKVMENMILDKPMPYIEEVIRDMNKENSQEMIKSKINNFKQKYTNENKTQSQLKIK